MQVAGGNLEGQGQGNSRLESRLKRGRKITGETLRTPVREEEKKKECALVFS